MQMQVCQEYGLVVAFSLHNRPLNHFTILGCFAGAGYGSHNTGTEVTRGPGYEQGQDTGHGSYTGSGSQGYGTGTGNQGYSSSTANHGYNSSSGNIC